MKKEDIKKAIDLVEPDIYMETRLKAKSIPVKKHSGIQSKAIAGGIALCLIFAMVFGLNLPEAVNTPTTEGQSQQNQVKVNPFIMVASAAETETDHRTLNINDTFPFAYKISVTDIRGISEEEKEEAMIEAQEMLNNISGSIELEPLNYSTSCIRGGFENIIFIETMANSIKLDLADKENIKEINVKNSSEWGYVEYYDSKLIETEQEEGKDSWVPRGNEITITAEQYHQDSGGFHWKNSYKLDNAVNDDPDMPLSTFKDTVTFTVEYNDGSKETGIIDVSFDDDGNATFTARDYSYSE